MASTKTEVISVVLGVITTVSVGIGLYGTFTAENARQQIKIESLEKEQKVSTTRIVGLENELDVLWVDTQKHEGHIEGIRRDQERFDDAFVKFADATERLSISVARLEERMRSKENEERGH